MHARHRFWHVSEALPTTVRAASLKKKEEEQKGAQLNTDGATETEDQPTRLRPAGEKDQPQQAQAPKPQHRTATNPTVMIAVAAYSCLVVTLLQSLVVLAVPQFPELIGTTPLAVSWLVTSTLLVGAAATPIIGALSDILPRRPLMVATMGLVLVGSLIAPFGGITTLIIGRSLQGLGTALIPVAMAEMRHSLPGDRIAGALALLSATLGIGIPLGGVLMSAFGWQSMFVVAVILSAIGTFALWKVMPEDHSRSEKKFDYVGAVLLVAALSSPLVVLSQGQSWGWGSAPTLILLVVGVVIAFAWGAYELRANYPLVDLGTASSRPILLTNIASILMGILMFTNLLLTTLELQNPVTENGFGWSASSAGLAMLPSAAVMFAVAPISARLSEKIGPRLLLTLGAGITGLGYVMRVAVHVHPAWTILAATILSTGVGIAYAAMPMVIVEHAPAAEIGSANAVNALMRAIGMAVASAMVSAMTAAFATTIDGTQVPTSGGLMTIGLTGVGMSLVAAILAFLARPSERAGA